MRLSEQTKKVKKAAVVILIVVVLVILILVAIPGTDPLPPVPSPTPTPTPSPTPISERLLGEIEDVQILPGKGDEAQVFIQMSIRNTGAPTGVDQYVIRINQAQSKSIDFTGPPDKMTERYTLPRDGQQRERALVIQPQDSIMSRTEQAITQEAPRVRGWLKLTLPLPADVLRRPGTQYTVSFADAARVSYTTPTYRMQ